MLTSQTLYFLTYVYDIPTLLSYLMNGEDVSTCLACDCDFTVELKCGDFVEVRQSYYEADSLQQPFQEISGTFWGNKTVL